MMIKINEAKEVSSFLDEFELYIVGSGVDMPLHEFLDHSAQAAYAKGFDDGFRASKERRNRPRAKKVRSSFEEIEKCTVGISLRRKDS